MKKIAAQIFLVIVWFLGTCTMSLAQEGLKKAIADLDKGWQNLDIPRLDKAVKAFEDMAKKNPNDYLAPYYTAKAHFAIADCLDIKSNQEFDQTGESDKHIDAALDFIKTSLAIKAANVDIQVFKFHAVRRRMLHVGFPSLMRYVGDRMSAYNEAKKLAPESPGVQLLDAFQVMDGGPPPPPEKPIAEFKKLSEKYPQMAEAYYQIGVLSEKAGKTDEAKKSYEKALKVDPYHHWAKKKLNALTSGKAKSP